MTYEPRENDYVIWTNDLGQVFKGWVYFVTPHSDNQKRIKEGWKPLLRYASIEIGTKPRPQCDLSKFFHKRIHICLICPEHEWGNLIAHSEFICIIMNFVPELPLCLVQFSLSNPHIERERERERSYISYSDA